MQIKHIAVTGTANFLYRHQFLFKELSSHFNSLEFVVVNNILHYENPAKNLLAKNLYRVLSKFSPTSAERLWKNEKSFVVRSKIVENQIQQLKQKPDLIFQVFGTYSSCWSNYSIPYVMYLDYTMALCKKNWSIWSPFPNQAEYAAWMQREQTTYKQATHLFTMSNLVKSSLIEDYGVDGDRITVVGSAGNCAKPYVGEKHFGSKQILFNGSDFKRKGGDILLEAFSQVKAAIPEAKLVIIGKKLSINENGVENLGIISSLSELENLFLASDLVAAPARCDPFPTFLMEAMNYGVPCVVSPRDGMPEIVNCGVNGIVVKDLTPKHLAEQIINLLSDTERLKLMSEQAQNKVRNTLNWRSVANNISQVLLNKI